MNTSAVPTEYRSVTPELKHEMSLCGLGSVAADDKTFDVVRAIQPENVVEGGVFFIPLPPFIKTKSALLRVFVWDVAAAIPAFATEFGIPTEDVDYVYHRDNDPRLPGYVQVMIHNA